MLRTLSHSFAVSVLASFVACSSAEEQNAQDTSDGGQTAGDGSANSTSDGDVSASDGGTTDDAAVSGGTLAGVKDTAFGTIGYKNTAAPARSILKSVALPARKEVYLYTAHSTAGILGRGVVRFSEDGNFDAAYGTSGLYEKSDAALELSYGAFTVDSQGRAYMVGLPVATWGAQVTRLTSTGTVDGGFGAGGIYLNPTDAVGIALPRLRVTVATTLADDSILMAGFAQTDINTTASRQWVVFKMTSAGALDSGFGSGGGVARWSTGTKDEPNVVHVTPSGDIFVIGTRDDTAKTTIAVKLSSAGIVDTAYGSSGTATIGTGSAYAVYDATTDGSGGLIAVGRGGSGKLQGWVKKLTTNGQSDSSFGTSGETFVNFYETFVAADKNDDLLNRVWRDASGRIVVAGYTTDTPTSFSIVARLLANGTMDTSFEASRTEAMAKISNYGYAGRFLADNILVGERRPIFPTSDGEHIMGILLQANTTVHSFVRWR